MKKGNIAQTVLGTLIFLHASASWGASVYRWVDERGQTHFSEKPPAPGIGEKIRVNPSPRATQSSAEKAKTVERTSNVPPPPGASFGGNEPTPAIKKQCEQLVANLRVLQTNGRIREQSADGEIRMLSEEEIQGRIREAEVFIRGNCQQATP